MVSMNGWVATTTGLPSLRIDNRATNLAALATAISGGLTVVVAPHEDYVPPAGKAAYWDAGNRGCGKSFVVFPDASRVYMQPPATVTVMAGDRVVCQVPGNQLIRVSDVFAPVGVPVKYTAGTSTVTLVRAPFGPEGSCLISGLDGRGVVGDFHEDIGEPYRFKSGAERATNGRVRANPRGDLRTGEARVSLDSADKYEALTDLLERPGRKLLTLDAPAKGVRDVKCLWVTDVDRVRSSHVGEFEFHIKYAWQDANSPPVTVASPLTFAEVEAAGVLWGDVRTFDQVATGLTGGEW